MTRRYRATTFSIAVAGALACKNSWGLLLNSGMPVKDVPGRDREAKAAEKKVQQVQRSLGDHVAKHGCNRDQQTSNHR